MQAERRFLPDQAMRFVAAAVRVLGPDASGGERAGRAVPDEEAPGQQILSLVFGLRGGQRLPDVLADLARDPDSSQARDELELRMSGAFEADPAMASQAAAVIAAFYRQRADAGDAGALADLGDFLYWDEPEAARAVYQEAIEAGHRQAMITLARLLYNFLDDEQAALAVLEQAAAGANADLSAEAMHEIASMHVSNRDEAAARAMFERVIGTGHPVWAAAAMVGLAGVLERSDNPEGAQALYREAIEAGDADWSAHASWLLGDLLESKDDIAGARAAWQRVIDSRSPGWAGPAFISLVNLLVQQEDADGLRAVYVNGAALDHPDAPYALVQLGQLLENQGDVPGAHEAWQQAIDAGCEDPGYLRDRMSPAPAREPETTLYPPGLPPEFNPRNMLRTGLDVLEHGLPPLPEALTHEMAIPIAYWTAGQCAVVLVLQFSRHGHDDPHPIAMQVTYSRGEDGRWQPPTHVSGGSFSHDPVRNPGSTRDLDGNPMVYGGSSQAREVTPGRPASIAAGRAAPEVKYLTVTQDARVDRRPLESHFGAWVVCTEQPGSFTVTGLDAAGAVLASLPHPFRPAIW
jgi:tetratricopeptide (TPR) repeat protein